MKKLIIILSLLFMTSSFLYAKEVYTDESSGKEYLFLGSISYDPDQKIYQMELFDLKNNTITWIDKNKLQQSNQLNAGEFLEKIFERGLLFHADGSTPYWSATISEKKLQISKPDGVEQELAIVIDLDKNPMDGVFLMMFQSEDRKTFGAIRMLGGDSACLINNEGETYFEVFINLQGEVIKGCARLEKM